MSASNIVTFMEPAGQDMTIDKGLAFIERSRRQLDRFSVANPAGKGMRIVPAVEDEIRADLDALEADLLMTKNPS